MGTHLTISRDFPAGDLRVFLAERQPRGGHYLAHGARGELLHSGVHGRDDFVAGGPPRALVRPAALHPLAVVLEPAVVLHAERHGRRRSCVDVGTRAGESLQLARVAVPREQRHVHGDFAAGRRFVAAVAFDVVHVEVGVEAPPVRHQLVERVEVVERERRRRGAVHGREDLGTGLEQLGGSFILRRRRGVVVVVGAVAVGTRRRRLRRRLRGPRLVELAHVCPGEQALLRVGDGAALPPPGLVLLVH